MRWQACSDAQKELLQTPTGQYLLEIQDTTFSGAVSSGAPTHPLSRNSSLYLSAKDFNKKYILYATMRRPGTTKWPLTQVNEVDAAEYTSR
jgi:hypothetical protein